MPEISDQKLISLYLAGDEKSLEILYNRYLKMIYSFIYRYVGDQEAAADVAQEVFVKVWKNLKKFNPRKNRFANFKLRRQKNFKTWLFKIAKNASIDFLRKKKTIPFSSFDNEDGNALTDTLADPAPLPDALLERQDLANLLTRALAKISFKYRAVLLLRYNNYFTFREIAESLGEPLNTIKSRHRRALIILKKIFGKSSF
ncbi:MAG: sigma-70 family RNA polymerase sigma factor [bacterium]|nr:sigma-70 family RNA polymerase sigma factor [bacterium]